MSDKITLSRPFNRKEQRRMYSTPSCWDCENIRIGRQFYRTCEIIPSQHIWAGSPKQEVEEMGFVVAERCQNFNLANGLNAFFPAYDVDEK